MSHSSVVFRSALLGVLGLAVVGSTMAITQRGDDYRFLDPLIEVRAQLSRRYVQDLDDPAMQNAAIQGMIQTLDDPFTAYVPPADESEFRKHLIGEYVGIGALVQHQDGWLKIVSPLEDSPAFDAGLLADDLVLEIDGTSTADLTADECVDLLTGEPGTPVVLAIDRAGRRFDVTVTRAHIVTRTVKGVHRTNVQGDWDYMVDPARHIAYIRLTQFNPASAAEFDEVLTQIGAAQGKVGGMVLDLRGNPGGVMQVATHMADLFLRQGTIVSTRGRSVGESVENASEPGTLPDFAMAILVNGQSASASEILAGALVENDRAVVIGSRTFGKGSVQSVIPLRTTPGAQLKLTEAYYYLPSGRCLHRRPDSTTWGVDPSPGFYVPMSAADLADSIRIRREQEIIRNGAHDEADAQWSDPDWILDQLRDPQLAAAVRAVQGRIDTGVWTPTGQAVPEDSQIRAEELANTERYQNRLLGELARVGERLTALSEGAEPPEPTDLWDDQAKVEGGSVKVFDDEGTLVATLRVTGPRLEQWLQLADVEPETAAGEDPTESDAP